MRPLTHVDVLQPSEDRALWRRGVLASYGDVTPSQGDRLTQLEGKIANLESELEKLDLRTSAIAAAQAEMRLSLMKAANPDVTSLRLTPATVVAIVAVVISLAGGYLTLRDSIAQLRQGQQMQALDINSLTNTVKDAIRQMPKGQP